MEHFDKIKATIIDAIYEYKLNIVHNAIIDFIDICSKQLENGELLDPDFLKSVFEAYQNHDYLRLADILEFEV